MSDLPRTDRQSPHGGVAAIPVPLLDLQALHAPIEEELTAACRKVLQSGRFILGENVIAFEAEMARYCGTAHGVGVASGSDALYLCLRAFDIGPGDEVITTSFSFIATADSISLTGARPVFVDIEPDSFNIDASQVEAAVNERTRAIIPVHLFGLAADMDRLNAIAARHDIKVIEDNAQALGSRYGGRMTGSLADAAALSFFPSKNLGCLGDGGMVLTDDDDTAAKVRRLRAHGCSRKYHATGLGLNSRLDEIQAAILRAKLPHLDDWNAARRDNATRYFELLKNCGGIGLPADKAQNHVYHQFTVRVKERERVQKKLTAAGIGTAVYYPEPLHLQPVFSQLSYRPGDFPEAERACRQVLSLPIGPELDQSQVDHVAERLSAITGGGDGE